MRDRGDLSDFSVLTARLPRSRREPSPRAFRPAASSASPLARAGQVRVPFVTRRRLRVALAVLWLLDGALQLQPFMFTRGFAQKVIAPSAAGQPAFVAAAVHWSAALIGSHPVLFDMLFAGVQLIIGAGMLLTRTVRVALAASVAWALGVWLLGEGLGGIGGGATFLSGAPGAVVLYAGIGLAAWPRLGSAGRGRLRDCGRNVRSWAAILKVVGADEQPASWVPVAWTVTWVLFAILQALPANNGARALGAQIAANAANAPDWLAHTERAMDAVVRHQGVLPVAMLVALEAAIGLLALRPGVPRKVSAVMGIALALAVWVIGQAFGQIPTGMGTDPNSAPLVALLGVAVLGRVGPVRAGSALRNRRSGAKDHSEVDQSLDAA